MSAREWKPGDVAIIIGGSARRGQRAMFCDDGVDRRAWAVASTDGLTMTFGASELRPLVVIDPENREDVERFVSTYFAEWEKSSVSRRVALPGEVMPRPSHVDAAQAALREFVNPRPPKPEEPTGLGAVVEDAEGVRWVSWRSGLDTHDRPWQRLELDTDEYRNYADIAAVVTHFEGVTP